MEQFLKVKGFWIDMEEFDRMADKCIIIDMCCNEDVVCVRLRDNNVVFDVYYEIDEEDNTVLIEDIERKV